MPMCLFMAESQAPSQDWFLQALPCLVLSHSLAFQCLFHCLDLEFIHLAIPILYLASFYKPNKNGTHLAGKTSKPTSDSTTLICPDRKRRERETVSFHRLTTHFAQAIQPAQGTPSQQPQRQPAKAAYY